MKQFYISCLAALATACAFSTGASADNKVPFKRHGTHRVAVQQSVAQPKQLFTTETTAANGPKRVKPAQEVEASVSEVPNWGFILGPDKTYWLYTQDLQYAAGTYNQITSSLITLYDSKHNKKGEIKIDIPEGKFVNNIEPYGNITNKFFDRDESTQELLVYVHEVGANYTNIDSIFAYNTKGELVQRFNGDTGVQFDASVNDWTRYERFILVRDTLMEVGGEKINHSKIEVYKPGGWGATNAVVDHTFYLDNRLWNYSEGPYVNTYNIDGNAYYAISYYEKEYDSNQDNHLGDYSIVPTENNSYIVDVYNKNYEKVKTVKVPIEIPDDMAYRFASFGMFDKEDLSIGKFTGDDDFNLVISISDYVSASDNCLYTYEVYNGNSEKVKTIATGVNVFKKMANIVGKEEQYLFMKTTDEGEYLDMVNVPSCEKMVTIPATLGENIISTNMDRYAHKGTYRYAISLSTPYIDNEENVYGQVGWYDGKSLDEEEIVKFNIGQNGLYVNPLLTSVSLNPYLFDTDNGHEYIYLSNVARDGSELKDTYLTIADSDGTQLKQWALDPAKGAIRTVSLINDHTDNPALSIAYYNDDTYKFHIDFITLPLEKFAKGGDGSKGNPFLVASAGDLMQINNDPDAHYVQVADIDMNSYNNAWTPLREFRGTYNGNGHAINNLVISGSKSYYLGLFEGLGEKAEVRHITFNDPYIVANDHNEYVSVLAGSAIAATIEGVHINYPVVESVSDSKESFFGGIVATAALETEITNCSFNNAEFNMPAAIKVGGIAGETLTSTIVNSCAVSGQFEAGNTLGAIVGYTGKGAEVNNCHANATLKAQNGIGGIVGTVDSRAAVKNNVAEGTIEATTEVEAFTLAGRKVKNGYYTGGIIGTLSPDWTTVTTQGEMIDASKASKIVTGNLVNISEIIIPKADTKTTHNIVGFSIENEENDRKPSVALIELGLDDNYYAATMTIAGQTNESVNDTTTTGASKAVADINADFLKTIGFAYGTTASAPWTGTAIPVLFFESDHALGIEAPSVNKPVISITDDTHIYNLAGQRIAKLQKGINIVNGKKIFVK